EAERGIPDACRTRDARRVGGPPSISESRPAAAIATRAASAKPFSADLRPGLEPRLERRGELANRQAPHRLAALLELLVIDGHHPSAANVQTVVAIAAIGQRHKAFGPLLVRFAGRLGTQLMVGGADRTGRQQPGPGADATVGHLLVDAAK